MDPSTQYTPRDLVEAMVQLPAPTTFLANLFVNRRIPTDKTIIEIDQVFGGQVAAGYVNRQGGPNQVGKAGYKTPMHVAPYIYEELTYTPKDVDTRVAGQTIYGSTSTYLDILVSGWLMDLEGRFIRAEEKQIAEALQTGKVQVTGKDVDYEVDFGMKATHLKTLTAGDMWSANDGDAKMAQLEDWAEQIMDTGAPTPTTLLGERKAMNYLINDDVIKSNLDIRRLDRGEINIRVINGQRATYYGSLRGAGLDIDLYTYQGIYDWIDPLTGTKTSQRYMNDYTVVLCSPGAQDFRFHYGKIENFETGDFIGQRFPMFIGDRYGKKRSMTMESAPLVGFHQTDAVISVVVHTP